MVSAIVMKREVAVFGLGLVLFAIGYGLFLANLFHAGVDGGVRAAIALMAGGLLLLLAIAISAMIELQRFLGEAA